MEHTTLSDYPAMYRSLRESFIKLKRHNADLEIQNSKLRSALYSIKADTNDEQSRTDCTLALRGDGLGDID